MSGYVRRLAAPGRLALGGPVRLVGGLALAAWIVCAWLWLEGSGARSSQWWCMPGMAAGGAPSSGAPAGLLAKMPMWLLMTAAMALPGELPVTQYVATNSFARFRTSAVSVFVTVYLLTWLACGLVLSGLALQLDGLPAGALFGTVLALAAGYELTPLKRHALNRCHRGAALPPRGARRLAAVARFGWINASGCVASCWPAMTAALLVPLAQPLAMLAFTAAMTYERLAKRPVTARRRIASGYLAVAAAFALAAL